MPNAPDPHHDRSRIYHGLPAGFFELVKTGTPKQVASAIDQGADVNSQDFGYTPLRLAAAFNPNPEVIPVLLKAGADLTTRSEAGETALMLAAGINRNPECITTLLKAGSNIEAKDKTGVTALMCAAAINPNLEMITTLLEAGADTGAKDGSWKNSH